MRQYLILQGMQSGKSLGESFYGRAGMLPYGQGSMLLGADQNGQGKVCEYNADFNHIPRTLRLTDRASDTSPYLSITHDWQVDACGTKHHGPHHLLLAR